jgi:hypothetical protein
VILERRSLLLQFWTAACPSPNKQTGVFPNLSKQDTILSEEKKMKTPILAILFALLLSSCNGWIIQPLPGPTPFLPPTSTPSIYTPTPVIMRPNTSTPSIATSTFTATGAVSPTQTNTPQPTDTVPAATMTASLPGPSISIKILGCNTGIDVTHGMGEVTNAFVTLKNTGGTELTNLQATLFALDEGRAHPDKTVELTTLPVGYQVTVKLTVDSTYKQETPIQVLVTSDQGEFPREGVATCTDIGIFAPNPESLKTPVPNVP